MGVGVVAWVVLGGVVVLPILDGLDEGNGSVNDVGDVRNRRISLSNSEIAAMAVNAPSRRQEMDSGSSSPSHSQ